MADVRALPLAELRRQLEELDVDTAAVAPEDRAALEARLLEGYAANPQYAAAQAPPPPLPDVGAMPLREIRRQLAAFNDDLSDLPPLVAAEDRQVLEARLLARYAADPHLLPQQSAPRRARPSLRAPAGVGQPGTGGGGGSAGRGSDALPLSVAETLEAGLRLLRL